MSAAEEASAGARAHARAIRDTFVALLAEGFTEDQAIKIIGVLTEAYHTPPEDGS